MDQVVENNRSFEGSGFRYERASILKHHRAGGTIRFILRRNIDPVIAHRAGVNLAGPLILGDLALGDVGVPLGIRPQHVVLG